MVMSSKSKRFSICICKYVKPFSVSVNVNPCTIFTLSRIIFLNIFEHLAVCLRQSRAKRNVGSGLVVVCRCFVDWLMPHSLPGKQSPVPNKTNTSKIIEIDQT